MLSRYFPHQIYQWSTSINILPCQKLNALFNKYIATYVQIIISTLDYQCMDVCMYSKCNSQNELFVHVACIYPGHEIHTNITQSHVLFTKTINDNYGFVTPSFVSFQEIPMAQWMNLYQNGGVNQMQ